MASRKAYPCFACRDKGLGDNVMVLLEGKDSEGKTKYLNEDGTRHTHQGSSATQPQPKMSGNQAQPTQQQQAEQQLGLPQILHILQGLESKIDHLTKLVYALSEQEQQHDQNPHTLLDNR